MEFGVNPQSFSHELCLYITRFRVWAARLAVFSSVKLMDVQSLKMVDMFALTAFALWLMWPAGKSTLIHLAIGRTVAVLNFIC